MGWLAEKAERRGEPARPVAGGRRRRHARPQLRPGQRSAGEPRRDATAPPSRSMPAIATITISSRASSSASPAASPPRAGRDGEGLRRHRAADGKAAGRGRRHRLAGQAHQSRQPRLRLVAVPRRHPHRGARCRPTSPRPTIAAPAAPASTSARPTPSRRPTGSMPAAASPISPSSTPGPIPHEFRAAMGNRIYGCDDCLAVCPWNKFARDDPRGEARGPRRSRRAAACRARGARRRRLPRPLLRLAGQAHRPRPLPAQRPDRHRQFRSTGACRERPGPRLADPAPLVRGAAVWALSRLLPAEAFAALRAERICRRKPIPMSAPNGRRA